jgi:dienelactone hydrolase
MVDLTGSSLPSALRAAARWRRLGPSRVPAMLAHPDWERGEPVPAVIWMHGRTVSKEIDPGHYLRLLRAGIGVCAVDLPGHGERFDAALQPPERAWDVVMQMIDEIDEIIDAVSAEPSFDSRRLGIGGMSAGGMAALARLCFDHPFRCASVEATSGSWMHQRHRRMFRDVTDEQIHEHNPIEHLRHWREIPLQAFHAINDEWVGIEGQKAFLEALRARYAQPELVELIQYDRTGAPYEHAGFGRHSADAKDRQAAFFARWLRAGD